MKYLEIPPSNPQVEYDNFSGIDEKPLNDQPKPKKTGKKVTIQDNPVTSTTIIKTGIKEDEPKRGPAHRGFINQEFPISVLVLTPEGSLLVYYITNIVVSGKYEEALKIIENFGLKL